MKPIVCLSQLVIWVDPLDGTAEYTQGKESSKLSPEHQCLQSMFQLLRKFSFIDFSSVLIVITRIAIVPVD